MHTANSTINSFTSKKQIYFLPILGVIIVYGGKMLSVERLYLRESRFKYGRILAKFPLKFSICPADCCQIERNSSQDKRLIRPTEGNSRVSVHKNIYCSQKSPYKTLDLTASASELVSV